jgi:hypothetical protein
VPAPAPAFPFPGFLPGGAGGKGALGPAALAPGFGFAAAAAATPAAAAPAAAATASSTAAGAAAAAAAGSKARRAARDEAAVKVNKLLAAAKAAYGEGAFAAAAAKYGEVLRLRPGDHTVLCNRGAAHMMLRQYDEVIADCTAAVALHPKYALALLRLVRAHLYLGDVPAARDMADDALAAASQARRSALAGSVLGAGVGTPASPEERSTLEKQVREAERLAGCIAAFADAERSAERELQAGHPRVCLDILRDAAAEYPECKASAASALLGARARLELHDYAGAAEHCRAVLPSALRGSSEVADMRPPGRLGDALLETAVVHALACWALEDWAAADFILGAVQRLRPQLGLSFTLPCAPPPGSASFLDGGAPEKARSAHRTSAVGEVHRTLRACEATRKHGNDMYRDGRWDDALRAYTAALKACADAPAVAANLLSNRAAAQAAKGDHAAAVADCTAALAHAGAHTKARLRRARAYTALKEYAKAAGDFGVVLEALRRGQPEAGPGGRSDATPEEVQAEADAVRRAAEAAAAAARRAAEAKRAAEAEEAARRRRQQQQQQQQNRWRHGGRRPSSDEEEDEDTDEEEGEEWRGGAGTGGGRGRGSRRDDDDDGYADFFARFNFGRGGAAGGGIPRGRAGAAGGGAGAGQRFRAPPPPRPPSPPPPHDFYALLHVSIACTEREVRTNYRALALKHHPDKGGDGEVFKLVGNAVAVLTDPTQRRVHDAELAAYRRRHPGWRYAPPTAPPVSPAAAAAGGAAAAGFGGAAAGAGSASAAAAAGAGGRPTAAPRR